jgi:hypothetical protein
MTTATPIFRVAENDFTPSPQLTNIYMRSLLLPHRENKGIERGMAVSSVEGGGTNVNDIKKQGLLYFFFFTGIVSALACTLDGLYDTLTQR